MDSLFFDESILLMPIPLDFAPLQKTVDRLEDVRVKHLVDLGEVPDQSSLCIYSEATGHVGNTCSVCGRQPVVVSRSRPTCVTFQCSIQHIRGRPKKAGLDFVDPTITLEWRSAADPNTLTRVRQFRVIASRSARRQKLRNRRQKSKIKSLPVSENFTPLNVM